MQNPTDDELSVWCGNLPNEIDEDLLFELFLQVGPLKKVRIPMDRLGNYANFGFVTFKHIASVPYAVQLLNNTTLFDRHIIVKVRRESAQNKLLTMMPTHLRPPPLLQTLIPNEMLLGMLPMVPVHMVGAAHPHKDRSRHGHIPYRHHHRTHYSNDRKDRSRRRF